MSKKILVDLISSQIELSMLSLFRIIRNTKSNGMTMSLNFSKSLQPPNSVAEMVSM